jgi:threonine aldolase
VSERQPVDLRSDTVTRPTPEMRRAMAAAAVGDDYYGEDPTVRALEERAAAILGKEAALYVATGTLANQLAVKVWTRPGQQVIVEAESHLQLFEPTSLAMLAGVLPNPVPTAGGWFGPDEVVPRLDGGSVYATLGTGLVAVEDTHNHAGGTLYPLDVLADLGAFCRRRRIPLHMDGARLFNAAVAGGVAPAAIAAHVDSLMFCLSKGLACPVGSVLAGPADFIAEAREVRIVFGGAWRQAGIIAAAGLVALDSMVERLAEDHVRARRLAEGLAAVPGIRLDPARVATNIVIFESEAMAAPELEARLGDEGVRCLALDPARIRMVTHYEITDADVDAAVAAVESCQLAARAGA